MITELAIPKFKFSHPARNLPGRRGVATKEDRFTLAFMRAYAEQAPRIHPSTRKTSLACAREIPVNGYGIADLYVVAWESLPTESFPDVAAFINVAKPSTRAFECKLTDWRKALSQASRYRFFANQTIVVLPVATCDIALRYLRTFKAIGVGLWSFDVRTNRITAHHTPRPTKARSEKYYSKAMHSVASASRQALPIR